MPPSDRNFRPADGYLTTEEFLRCNGSVEPGRLVMKKFWIAVVVAAFAFGSALYAEDVVHAVSGIVKSVDKTSKTMVVKTKDGTEQTIKWTDKTTVEGAKGTAKGVSDASVATYNGAKEGAAVTVKYTEKGGEKTAVAVKDASKATADATKKAADKTVDAVK
jgi:hypothetical protein